MWICTRAVLSLFRRVLPAVAFASAMITSSAETGFAGELSGKDDTMILAQNLPRLNVKPNINKLPPTEFKKYHIPAYDSIFVATAAGFSFRTDNRSEDDRITCRIETDEGFLFLKVHYDGAIGGYDFGLMNLPKVCAFRLFGGRRLASGWSFDPWVDLGPPGLGSRGCIQRHGRLFVGEQQSGGTLVTPIAPGNPYRERPHLLIQALVYLNENTCEDWVWHVRSFRLTGPAGQDWRQAFER